MASREEADRTLAAHAASIIGHPNVSSIGVIDEDGGTSIIEIGLVRAEAEAPAGARSEPIPDALEIPDRAGRLSGSGATIAVRKRVIGDIYAQSFTNRVRPANGGNSCGPSAAGWYGTLGARVKKGETVCILSNWHVLYGGVGQDNSTIIQPARPDGGSSPDDTIASNLSGVLSDYVDAAIAKVADPVNDNVSAGTRCYGPITGVGVAADKMAVKKCGRTTESTAGVVRSTNVTVKVNGYYGGTRVFSDQIEMSPMSEQGDSGAILLSDDGKAVGLVFAGGGGSSYANKIQRVIDALGIGFA